MVKVRRTSDLCAHTLFNWLRDLVHVLPMVHQARTVSPATIIEEGFTGSPLTFTCPALHASEAAERVLYSLTAHTYWSTRTDSAG